MAVRYKRTGLAAFLLNEGSCVEARSMVGAAQLLATTRERSCTPGSDVGAAQTQARAGCCCQKLSNCPPVRWPAVWLDAAARRRLLGRAGGRAAAAGQRRGRQRGHQGAQQQLLPRLSCSNLAVLLLLRHHPPGQLHHHPARPALALTERPAAGPLPGLQGGYSALHLAAKAGHRDVIELLVKSGADVNAKNDVRCCSTARRLSWLLCAATRQARPAVGGCECSRHQLLGCSCTPPGAQASRSACFASRLPAVTKRAARLAWLGTWHAVAQHMPLLCPQRGRVPLQMAKYGSPAHKALLEVGAAPVASQAQVRSSACCQCALLGRTLTLLRARI